MGIFGGGGINGEEAAQRRDIIASIPAETDVRRLAMFIAFDQVEVDYDPCGRTDRNVNPMLTDMSRKAVARLNELFGFSGVRP